MEEIKKRAAKLIDVKSIVTLMVALVFCVMALCGVIGEQAFLTIFTVIISFYFGTQVTKKAETADQKTAVEPVAAMAQDDRHPPDSGEASE